MGMLSDMIVWAEVDCKVEACSSTAFRLALLVAALLVG